MICISIDPSINKTGICLWVNGIPTQLKTLYCPKTYNDEHTKLLWLAEAFRIFCNRIKEKYGKINKIAIESFQTFQKYPTKSLMKLAAARGVLLAVAHEVADEVYSVNKGKQPKSNADWLALHYGITGSQDARDALHIGVISGFDLYEKKK